MTNKKAISRRKTGNKAAGAGQFRTSKDNMPVAQQNPLKRAIVTKNAALPVGPYSQGIRAANLIFVAGEKGIDPKSNQVVPGGIGPETRQALENIRNILAEEGATLDDAASSTVHMTDLGEFEEMNQVYADFFNADPPGRTTVGVTSLPGGARIEITITAISSGF